MTELNPLLEAMNNIDDNIIANAVKVPAKKPIRLRSVIIAAAAAATLLTGAAVVIRSGARLSNGVVVDYNFYAQKDLVFPSDTELFEMGAAKDGSWYTINALPTEVFDKFNLDIPVTENFVKEPTDIMIWTDDNVSKDVNFEYLLTNKTLNCKIEFKVYATDNEEPRFDSEVGVTKHAKTKFVTLKDGSEALIFQNAEKLGLPQDVIHEPEALFSYNGIIYWLDMYPSNNSDSVHTLDDMEQVLHDLGIL